MSGLHQNSASDFVGLVKARNRHTIYILFLFVLQYYFLFSFCFTISFFAGSIGIEKMLPEPLSIGVPKCSFSLPVFQSVNISGKDFFECHAFLNFTFLNRIYSSVSFDFHVFK